MPQLSIVVPVRHAEQTIATTIEALLGQCQGLDAEVIAVVSSKDPSRVLLQDGLVRVIEMQGARSVPQLRAEGIRAARGRLVATTEDHCLFSQDWAARMIEVHGTREVAAVGGPVENGRTKTLADWAIYFSRYAGSMPPLGLGSTRSLPGNNACYRREVLDRFASLYAHGFWENDFNRELLASGYVLWLDPSLVVTHNKPYRFGPYLSLRYRHARCFGGMIERRLGRVLLSPLIPALLVLRSARAIWRKGRRRREFVLCFPLLLLCYLAWFWGELAGYLLGPGDTCSQTD